jgi:adhesin transport system membrane fusion protein
VSETEVMPPPPGIVAALLAAVGLLGAWAYYGEIEIFSVAQGEIAPISQVKTVQHLEGGIVQAILVREGDRVRTGQPLLRLEPVSRGADVDELRTRIGSLRIDAARLEAEFAGAPAPAVAADLATEFPEAVLEARQLFDVRRRRLASDVRRHEEALVQRRQDIRATRARLAGLRQSLTLAKEQVEISETLLREELSNRFAHLALLREAKTIETQIEQDAAALPRAEAALAEIEQQIAMLHATFREEAQARLVETRQKLDEMRQRLPKYLDPLERTVLRAPADGIVKVLRATTVGGVVKAGDPVADIVPVDDRMIVEAYLAPGEVAYVQVGQEAAVRPASADALRFDRIAGRVTFVSPDTVTAPNNWPAYRVRIETEKGYFSRGPDRYDLRPGMQVVADIQIGRRTVLEYLLDPFLVSLERGLRER